MADNVVLNPGAGGQTISTDEIAGVQHQYVKVEFGVDGSATPVSTADPLPVAANIAAGSNIIGKVGIDQTTPGVTNKVDTGLLQPLTDDQLRALAVPVSLASIPLATNAATENTLAAMSAKLPATLGAKTTANSMSVNIASDQTVPVIQAAPTTTVNGHTTVTTAGTRVVLAGSTTVKSVTIKALGANTGIIYVGDSAVAAANGFPLYARDTISMDISNLNVIYIDSTVNGEGVAYISVN